MTLVSKQQFRDGMARLSAAVNVVTTAGAAGRCGFTASAVCSVSDEPPTLLVCMNRASAMNPVFKQNGVLCINTLSAEQQHYSALFAGQTDVAMAERFHDEAWTVLQTGSPVLENALVSFDCQIADIKEIGSHSVMFCTVLGVAVWQSREGLVYFDRGYRMVPAAETP
ncbi:flavin reductase [Ferrovibrio terrae]|uniref:flavin reductase n=1 Tax=Ferrovibrio terrae TaxID=2594003 RepID=UPI0031380640